MAVPGEQPDPDLARIHEALRAAIAALRPYTPGAVSSRLKGLDDPVTEADLAVNRALRETLVAGGEGWLSEETVDDMQRLRCRRLWIVDPIDGTREFVKGIPEWAVSVGLIEDGRPVAGGMCNPQTGELFLGSPAAGLTINGQRAGVSHRRLPGARLLASRSEIRRGEWDRFNQAGFAYSPMGSIAYKLALVAAGRADATFTLVPKSEWDVAAGVALVEAAGGWVVGLDGKPLVFNRANTKLDGLIAGSPEIVEDLLALLRQA